MKQIATALTLCALPAAAFAQDVVCLACDHVVPYFRGTGGFIGTVAQDADEVSFVTSCGSVTTTGEATIQDGTASQLFTRGNGLACDLEGGAFEIAGLEDGGWYWINDTWSSAVGNLISVDVLGNETIEITDPGATVSITAGRGAVFLKHAASGRVGILPNILPAPPPADPPATNYCDYTGAGAAAKPERTDCMLKDGTATIRAQGPADAYTGLKPEIANGGTVRRPIAEGATVEITYDLWSAGGQYVTADVTGPGALLGHKGGSPLSAEYTASASTGGPLPIGGLGDAGLTIVLESENVAELQIEPNTSYCNSKATPPANHSVTVTVTATATTPTQMTPPIKDTNATADGVQAATHKITVVCP